MKIVVFNVKYSENLGDGILAQCLEHSLEQHDPGIEVETIDLAGRTAFGTTHGRRQLAISILKTLPAFMRRWAVEFLLRSKIETLGRAWAGSVSKADLVVIGGGNLFQDDDLNFPLKVGKALDIIALSGKPLVIHAVGVSPAWSRRAKTLFSRLRDTNLKAVSVRDEIALQNWSKHFPGGPAASVLPDPGLLARELEFTPDNATGSTPTVGICVTAPMILLRHSDMRATEIPFTHATEYCALVSQLAAKGYAIRLFCNGAREDQAFAEQIFADTGLSDLRSEGKLQLAPRPVVPAELLTILSSLSVLVAHRLHACIAAYSLGVPPIGLAWDRKVAGFFDAVGRSDYYLSSNEISSSRVVDLVRSALETGIDSLRHSAELESTRDAITCIAGHKCEPLSESSADQKSCARVHEKFTVAT